MRIEGERESCFPVLPWRACRRGRAGGSSETSRSRPRPRATCCSTRACNAKLSAGDLYLMSCNHLQNSAKRRALYPRLRYPASWPPKTEQISRNLGQINSSSSVLGLRVNKESSCVNWLLLLLVRKAHKSLKDPVHARSEQTSSVWRWWETPTGSRI